MDNLYDSRMMQTFIYNPADKSDDYILLTGSEAKHLSKVLRLRVGETIRLVDGSGEAHICEITDQSPKQVSCHIIKTVKNSGEPSLQLTLAVGLSTVSKFDMVIEKGTEIGVSDFIPLVTEKGKVHLDSAKVVQKKMQRWTRVRDAAVKQSRRSVFPRISPPVLFKDFVLSCVPETTILFHPEGVSIDMVDVVRKDKSNKLTIITGPESGFSPEETSLASEKGIVSVSMGERILRTETAAIAFSAMAIYLY